MACLISDKTAPPLIVTLGWGRVLPLGLQHYGKANSCWTVKSDSFYQEGRERQPDWRVTRTTIP